jgi:hypothetical protein
LNSSRRHARHVRERIRVHRLDLGLLRKRWRNAPRASASNLSGIVRRWRF